MMYHLPKPLIYIAEVYPKCANRTEDPQLRLALLSEGPRVLKRSADYEQMALTSTLYQVIRENAIHVSNTELGDLYDRVLVSGGERPTYLAIRGKSLYGRCPLCAQRDVRTLDHYLPKASFPEFAVLPVNLVPCCFECNHAKKSYAPTISSEQIFHPYFDDWDHLELIRASIKIDGTVYAEFSVATDRLPTVIAERAIQHFQKLDLARLYSEHASVELVQRRADFVVTFEIDGADVLRTELLREYRSRRRPFPNAWQPALYQALAGCQEFVNGGVYSIEQ
jgi:hypothetical protein